VTTDQSLEPRGASPAAFTINMNFMSFDALYSRRPRATAPNSRHGPTESRHTVSESGFTRSDRGHWTHHSAQGGLIESYYDTYGCSPFSSGFPAASSLRRAPFDRRPSGTRPHDSVPVLNERVI